MHICFLKETCGLKERFVCSYNLPINSKEPTMREIAHIRYDKKVWSEIFLSFISFLAFKEATKPSTTPKHMNITAQVILSNISLRLSF